MFELEALICEREGMIAENKQREYLGQAMAYTEDSFLILADKIRLAQAQSESELGLVCDEYEQFPDDILIALYREFEKVRVGYR